MLNESDWQTTNATRSNNQRDIVVTKKQKLELTWIGKENRPRLEPRILLEDPEKSYHAQYRVKEGKALTAENTKSAEKRLGLCVLCDHCG